MDPPLYLAARTLLLFFDPPLLPHDFGDRQGCASLAFTTSDHSFAHHRSPCSRRYTHCHVSCRPQGVLGCWLIISLTKYMCVCVCVCLCVCVCVCVCVSVGFRHNVRERAGACVCTVGRANRPKKEGHGRRRRGRGGSSASRG